MSDIRKSLESLADSIEQLQNQPVAKPLIKDRELSGDKINGGTIVNFSSVGIKDDAATTVLTVKNDGIHVGTAHVKEIANSLAIHGSLDVKGAISATKLHVDEISADVRNERISPLEFKGEGKSPVGKGLIWSGGDNTKQFVLQNNHDRFWSSENIDLHREKSYMIGNTTVLSEKSLGTTVVKSNLKQLGALDSLQVNGSLNVDHFVKYNADTEQFSIGSEDPRGMFSIESLDHQFIIDPTEDKNFKVGTWTTSGIDFITDNAVRLRIENNGATHFHSKTTFDNPIGIGVNNFEDDVDLTVAGPIRIQNQKFENSDAHPQHGHYLKGDIVWNTDPKPTGYVGWVCIKAGTPGDWKAFGQISS